MLRTHFVQSKYQRNLPPPAPTGAGRVRRWRPPPQAVQFQLPGIPTLQAASAATVTDKRQVLKAAENRRLDLGRSSSGLVVPAAGVNVGSTQLPRGTTLRVDSGVREGDEVRVLWYEVTSNHMQSVQSLSRNYIGPSFC